MLSPYQVFAPLASCLAIYYAWNLVYRQRKTIWEAALWTAFWGMFAVVALFPDVLAYVSQLTGIKERENAIIFTSIGMLFFIAFYMVMRLEELEQRQNKLIRRQALSDAGLIEEAKALEPKQALPQDSEEIPSREGTHVA